MVMMLAKQFFATRASADHRQHTKTVFNTSFDTEIRNLGGARRYKLFLAGYS